MKTKQCIAVICLVISLLLPSCVKLELFNTAHPDKGAVVVEPDWSDALAESTVPQAYFVRVDNIECELSGKSACFPELLTPGTYNLLVYNSVDGIDISGTIAKVQKENGFLRPQPDYLFSALKEMTVTADDTLLVEVPMVRRLCPITLNFSLLGKNAGKVAAIEASLDGIAGSVDLQSGEVGMESNAVKLDIVEKNTADGIIHEMQCRVVGVCEGKPQTLTITLTMDGGYVCKVTSDLTSFLKGLNVSMKPIVLEGEVEAPVDGSFSATIEDWETASEENIDAPLN